MNFFKNDKVTIILLLTILVVVIALSSFLGKKSDEIEKSKVNNITIENYDYSEEAQNYFNEQGDKNYNALYNSAVTINSDKNELEIITD